MEVVKSNISSLLEGAKQYVIPIYQRTYSWEKSQCIRLWNDIMYIIEMDRSAHFIGSIVNIEDDRTAKGFQRFMIIDGQQRVTTVLLLMIAIRDYLKKLDVASTISHNEVNDRYIINTYETGDHRFKLMLTQNDKQMLGGLIDGRVDVFEQHSRIITNYHFFLDKINKMEQSIEELLSGIDRLQLVNISLDRANDDPQAIFESLNSTGVELSQSDLIRNYVLMKLDILKQEQVYNQYWLAFEDLFDYEKKFVDMDRFFRDYLIVKTGVIPRLDSIYDAFKKYIDVTAKDVISLARELYDYGKLYAKLLYGTAEDLEIKQHFHDMILLKVEVSYPAILQFYFDYQQEIITKDEFLYLLTIIESYVFRRSILEVPTNTLNRFFLGMLDAKKNKNYLASIKKYIKNQDEKSAFPQDIAFATAFKEREIYLLRNRKYILYKLESYDNKTPIDMERYTIEHIMPQSKNLSTAWKKDLGKNYAEIQKKYVHTIGNLTLTAYNLELSNNTFNEKKTMTGGFLETNLRLNKELIQYTTWNEKLMQQRAEALSELACDVWPYFEDKPKATKVKPEKGTLQEKNKAKAAISTPPKKESTKKNQQVNDEDKTVEEIANELRSFTFNKFKIIQCKDTSIIIYNDGKKVSAYPILMKLAKEHNIALKNEHGDKYTTQELGDLLLDFFLEKKTKQQEKAKGQRIVKVDQFTLTEQLDETIIVKKNKDKVSAYPILQKLAVENNLPLVDEHGEKLSIRELGKVVFDFFETNKS